VHACRQEPPPQVHNKEVPPHSTNRRRRRKRQTIQHTHAHNTRKSYRLKVQSGVSVVAQLSLLHTRLNPLADSILACSCLARSATRTHHTRTEEKPPCEWRGGGENTTQGTDDQGKREQEHSEQTLTCCLFAKFLKLLRSSFALFVFCLWISSGFDEYRNEIYK
jgi:hypothetical protein